MQRLPAFFDKTFQFFFSEAVRHRFENIIIGIAILGFLVHLGLIWLVDLDLLHLPKTPDKLLDNSISAIYTPFSFILVYEVYLLVFYLPGSTSEYIGKQYEIVSLIVIRRIFKDISNLELSINWFDNKYNIQLTADTLGFIFLFILIFWFYRLIKEKPKTAPSQNLQRFIRAKKLISLALIPLLMIMAAYSLGQWLWEVLRYSRGLVEEVTDVNNIFYIEFFTVLILIDVLLLLISYRYIEDYSKLIRNSGFIISTILIKLSFTTTGILNITLILFAVIFGVVIFWISNLFSKNYSKDLI